MPCKIRERRVLGNRDEPDEPVGDHWINQYWNNKTGRWITIDVDGSLNLTNIDPYDIPAGKFDFHSTGLAWAFVRVRLTATFHRYADGARGGNCRLVGALL